MSNSIIRWTGFFCYTGNPNNDSDVVDEEDPLNSSGGFAVQGDGTKRIVLTHEQLMFFSNSTIVYI